MCDFHSLEHSVSFYTGSILENGTLLGTAIFCKYNDNYYILSAGHVIREIQNTPCSLTVDRHATGLIINEYTKSSRIIENELIDIGFILIPDLVASQIETMNKVFYNLNKFPNDWETIDELMLITGFPRFSFTQSYNGLPASGGAFSVTYNHRNSDENNSINKLGLFSEYGLRLPFKRDTLQSVGEDISFNILETRLSGMSGSGLWRIHNVDSPNISPELIGIYIGENTGSERFLHFTLIGYFLNNMI